MTAKTIFRFVLNLSLLCLATFFCKKNFADYLEGKTYFVKTKEPLTPSDLPTLAICLPHHSNVYPPENKQPRYILGKNMHIKATSFDEKDELKTVVLLRDNKSVQTKLGLELLTTSVQQVRHQKSQCFKITSKWNGRENIKVGKYKFHLALSFNTTYNISKIFTHSRNTQDLPSVYITSEPNSYGVAWGRWFDGRNGKITLEDGIEYRILRVTENRNLDSPDSCSTDSYYKCLAKRLVHFDLAADLKFLNRSRCSTSLTRDDTCSTIPLPKIGTNEIPICKNDSKMECFEGILEKLRISQKRACIRSCRTIEYGKGKFKSSIYQDVGQSSNGFRFGLKFDVNLYSQDRGVTLEKTVYREYLVNTFMSLIGNVGGTLGMFVGFSILGATDWVLEWFQKHTSRLLKWKEFYLDLV